MITLVRIRKQLQVTLQVTLQVMLQVMLQVNKENDYLTMSYAYLL